MKQLQRHNVLNKVVVVTRWYNGNQLGRRRFNIISECTDAVIQRTHTANDPAHKSAETTPKQPPEQVTPQRQTLFTTQNSPQAMNTTPQPTPVKIGSGYANPLLTNKPPSSQTSPGERGQVVDVQSSGTWQQ